MKNIAIVQKSLILLYLVFLATLAVITADITATYIDKAINVPAKKESKITLSKKSEEKKRELIDYKSLFDINIFSVAVLNADFFNKKPLNLDLAKEAPPPPPPVEVRKNPPMNIGNYDLFGTIVAIPKIESLATIYNKTTRKYDIYGLKEYNNLIEDMYEIVGISRRSVEIKTEDGNITLELSEKGAKTPSSRDNRRPPPHPPAGMEEMEDSSHEGDQKGITKVSENHYIIDQRFYTELTENLSSLMKLQSQINFVPKLDNDKNPIGFEIRRIAPDSIFQQIGLKRGDVVKTINGKVISALSAQEGLQLLEEMKNETNLNLDIDRMNKPSTIGYEVR